MGGNLLIIRILFIFSFVPQLNRTVLQPQISESVDSVGSVSIPSNKIRRHSLNPANIPDFFRRVSIGPIGRRMSMRSGRRKSKCPSSTSQPHLHETLSGRVRSPPAGLERTKSVSGTFFRRTQRNNSLRDLQSSTFLFRPSVSGRI